MTRTWNPTALYDSYVFADNVPKRGLLVEGRPALSQLDPEKVARYVLLMVRDPLCAYDDDPATQLARRLDGAEQIGRSGMFTSWTGTHQGVPVTAISGGSGSPEAELILHELLEFTAADTFVRVGGSGGLHPSVEPGDVVVIDTGGDVRHAPLGEVVASALVFRGAAGAVVDGSATDIDEIAGLGLPVYARGLSMLTTKLHDIDAGGLNVPVVVGGVVVNPGDVVLADANGVLFASVAVLAALIDTALADDAEEPELVEELRAGGRLGDLTGATASVQALTR